MRVQSYRDLIAWQKAMELVVLVYRITTGLPREELYGFTRQTREAAVSVPSNIAEGAGRRTPGEFRQFLGVAHGSLQELETELLIGERLGYSPPGPIQQALELSAEVGRVINGLSNSPSISAIPTDH
jgi:four helix bundle protein